jgi:hypothetical protein
VMVPKASGAAGEGGGGGEGAVPWLAVPGPAGQAAAHVWRQAHSNPKLRAMQRAAHPAKGMGWGVSG